MKSALEIKSDISYKSAGKFEETRFEKIHNEIFKNSTEASIVVAQEIAQLIKSKQEKKKSCVLGLATGSSPIKVYEELVRMHKEEGMLTPKYGQYIPTNLDRNKNLKLALICQEQEEPSEKTSKPKLFWKP